MLSTFRGTLLLLTTYFVCWLPYHVSSIWSHIDEVTWQHYRMLLHIFEFLTVISSVLNPFIYGFFHSPVFCSINDCGQLIGSTDWPDTDSADQPVRRRTTL